MNLSLKVKSENKEDTSDISGNTHKKQPILKL